MKAMRILYISALMLVSSWTMAQGNFEGVITMNTTNEAVKETASVTWYLKGDGSRLDINSQAGEHHSEYSIITDGKGMDMVSEGHITPIPTITLADGKTAMDLDSETPNVSVNGFNCVKQVYSNGSNKVVYWLTDEAAIGFKDLPAFMRKNMPQIDSNAFPIKMEKRDATGKVVLSQEVLAITASKVDASKFERK